jgi:hypothetical protein
MRLTCPENTILHPGCNFLYTIGLTKNGRPRINMQKDEKLYFLLSAEGRYTRRGNGWIGGWINNTGKYKCLASGNGADGLAGIIGYWDCLLLALENETPENDWIRIRTGGGGYGIDPQWKGYRYYVAKLEMLDGLTSIGGEAFVYFENLSSVTIPETVTSIGQLAFGACEKISTLFIPEGVTSIAGGAFYGCSGIKSLVLSKNVNSIGMNAFYSCTSLEEIYNYAVTPQVIRTYQDIFYMVNQAGCTLYVPAGALSAYNSAEVWKDFNPILAIPGTEGTSIENINETIAKHTKFISEGQIYIQNGDKIYTINGTEIK